MRYVHLRVYHFYEILHYSEFFLDYYSDGASRPTTPKPTRLSIFLDYDKFCSVVIENPKFLCILIGMQHVVWP